MKKLMIDRYGIENLELRDVEEPHAGAGELRVKVSFASINPADWKMIDTPEAGEHFGTRMPSGFAMDFAGEVDEVGEGVEGFAAGDRVFGSKRRAAAAEYVVIPASAQIYHTPEGLSDELAATIVTGATAAYGAIGQLHLTEKDVVLINGAAGGVGTFATQLAARTGAKVLGTASEANADYVRGLGAEFVDYREDLAPQLSRLAPGGVSAVADLSGFGFVRKAVEDLGVDPGRVKTIAENGPLPAGVARTGAWEAPEGANEEVAELLAKDEIRIPIQSVYPLAEFAAAIDEQKAGHVRGKVLLSIG